MKERVGIGLDLSHVYFFFSLGSQREYGIGIGYAWFMHWIGMDYRLLPGAEEE